MPQTTFTSPDLLAEVFKKLNQGPYKFTTEQVRSITDAVFESVMDRLAVENIDKLVTPIGVFNLYQRGAYTGKHPKTGELQEIKERTLMKYRPSTELLRKLAQRSDTMIDTRSLYKKKKGE